MRSVTGCNNAQMMLRPRSVNGQHYRNSGNSEIAVYGGANCQEHRIRGGRSGTTPVNEENNEIWFSNSGAAAGHQWIPEFQFSVYGYMHYISAASFADCLGDSTDITHCPLEWIIRPITDIFSGDQAGLRDVCRPLILMCHEMLKNRLKEHEDIWQGELSPYPGKLQHSLTDDEKCEKKTQQIFFQMASKTR